MSKGRLIIGGLLVIVGIDALFDINIFRYLFPVLLIWLGWTIATGRKGYPVATEVNETDMISETLLFSGAKRAITSSSFKGGKLSALFGGAELDLSGVKTKEKEITLDIVAVFGGVKVIVPKQWNVKTDIISLVGGVSNTTVQPKDKLITLRLSGSALFGGVEVINN